MTVGGRASLLRRFAQNFIHYHTYEIDVQFIHPVQAFASQGVVGTLLIDFNLVRRRMGAARAARGLAE